MNWASSAAAGSPPSWRTDQPAGEIRETEGEGRHRAAPHPVVVKVSQNVAGDVVGVTPEELSALTGDGYRSRVEGLEVMDGHSGLKAAATVMHEMPQAPELKS